MYQKFFEKGIGGSHLFTNKDIWKLLLPVMVEQLLMSLMGTVDTMMVSNIGSEAISAVSLVDSINVLFIQAFAALAAGGTIVCSQYLGRKDIKNAGNSANQVVLTTTALSLVAMIICIVFRNLLLRAIFGSVDAGVMENSLVYFQITAFSFPFIAVFNAGSAVFRAQRNTRLPMTISVISNCLNIAGNACLIFVFNMGVAGAAISTLASRIFCAVVVMIYLRSPDLELYVRDYRKIRPDWECIRRVLHVGVPSGIENSMFQFGKLAIQSTVSTLGTAAIAAQAMTNLLENMNGIAALGMGIGMMTIIGQCIGADRDDEAVYYIKKITLWAEAAIALSCILVLALTRPVTILAGMEKESAALCFSMMCAITVFKPVLWVFSFILPYGMRAAGDVKFSMIVTCLSMWLCRVVLAVLLCRLTPIGPMGVWVAMFTDWGVRTIIFARRFYSGRWLRHQVI